MVWPSPCFSTQEQTSPNHAPRLQPIYVQYIILLIADTGWKTNLSAYHYHCQALALVPRPLSSIVIINQPSWRQFSAVTQTSSARKHALRCVKLWECGGNGGGREIRQFTQLEAFLLAGRMEKCNQEMSTEAEPIDTQDARGLKEIEL